LKKPIENLDTRLVFLKENQVVFSDTFLNLQLDIKSFKIDNRENYDGAGSDFYRRKLYELYYMYTIGYEHEMFYFNSRKHDYDYKEIADENIRLVLLEENKIIFSKKIIELPLLLREAYSEYLKSQIEICMLIDSAFICIYEYQLWLTKDYRDKPALNENNVQALKYFKKLDELKNQFQE